MDLRTRLPFNVHWFLRLALGGALIYCGLKGLKKDSKDVKSLLKVALGLVIFLGGLYKNKLLGLTVTQWAAGVVYLFLLWGVVEGGVDADNWYPLLLSLYFVFAGH